MSENNLSRLANSIANRQCVLFAGAGLTADSGGTTWTGLINHLFDKFNYRGLLDPEEDDSFEIFQDLYTLNDPITVYNEVTNKLKNVTINPHRLKLTTLPWSAIFTTNYDLAFEKSLRDNQRFQVKTVVSGNEFALPGLPHELLCIKLMGSLDVPYGQEGSMVLTQADFTLAKENRPIIFDMLASHANNLSFLFVGYSFNDGVFRDIINKLNQLLGIPKDTFYAVFRNEPTDKKKYWLKQHGIEIIVSELDEFTENISKEVAIHNPDDFSLKRIPIGNDIIPIDSTKVGSFLSLHNPVLFEDLQKKVSPDDFFKGTLVSFKPFGLNWHYPRNEKDKIIDKILKDGQNSPKTNIFVVEGSPGSGRTFLIMDSIYDLITKHRTLALKITPNTFNPIPRIEDLEDFIEEIEHKSKDLAIGNPERIVFWAEFALDNETILKFNSLSSNCTYPMYLIFEANKNYYQEDEFSNGFEEMRINVDIDLTEIQKNELKDYLIKVISKHPFGELGTEEAYRIVDDEKTLLPIMYRAIDPAKRSINKIIQDEFQKISNPLIKECISMCAYPTSLDLDVPLSALRKVLSKRFCMVIEYNQMFEIVEEAFVFLRTSEDIRGNPYFSIYHSLIAKQLIYMVGSSKIDEYLIDIAKTIDIRIPVEAEFVGNLLINKGMKLKGEFIPFTPDGLEKALLELTNRQPARPLLHHLAIFYSNISKYDTRIMPLLEQALERPDSLYALEERRENILTTMARMKWNQKKEFLLREPRNHPETQEVIDLLIQARKNVEFNPHTYVVHSRILKELASSKDDEDKMALINEALELLAEGLDLCNIKDKGCDKLGHTQIELLAEIDLEKAEKTAEELLETKGDGNGYYTLARIKCDYERNPTKASVFLDKALNANKCPSGAIALKIDILLQDKFPNYDRLLKLVTSLSSHLDYVDTWKSAYNKAIVYAINGEYDSGFKYFKMSNRKVPRNIPRTVEVFVMENGHRKTFFGKIGNVLTEREGRLYSHSFNGWSEDIFFNPRHQKLKNKLKKGYHVNFELGFSPRGPMAFDVRPYNWNSNDT